MMYMMQKLQEFRFDSHVLTKIALYLLMIAPPRAFDIKLRQTATQGELARYPTYLIMAIELVVRVAIILILAAGIEVAIGNTLYETHKIDVFFVTLVASGTLHSAAFFLIFKSTQGYQVSASVAALYRVIRNSCYAILTGFFSVLPVLIWNWDHEIPPYNDGLAVQLYTWTVSAFLVLGIIEARMMERTPLGAADAAR